MMAKIKAKKVVINWKEGTVPKGAYPMTFKSIREANKQILRNSGDAPKSGGYDKHSFTIFWDDGETYQGRLDVKHPSQPNADLSIGRHVKEWIEYGMSDRSGASAEEKKEYKDYLEKYDLEL